jgi:ABC-type lipoprotein release transport system permease subunit
MILKNLLRRRTRTLLAVLGTAIGIAAVVALGALADGLAEGYGAMMAGSRADLVLSQPDTFDISYSTVDENIGPEISAAPGVEAVSAMLQGFVQGEGIPFFFVFGYPEDSFVLGRFNVIDGVALESREARRARGVPLLLGVSAAEMLNRGPGESLRLGETVFRIVGVFQTGNAFEDRGAVLRLADAQRLLGRSGQVSLFYIRLEDPSARQRVSDRVARLWPDLSLSGTAEYGDRQLMVGLLEAYVWAISGLAIVVGGVGITNAQVMSVTERTHEIGVLRAVGWRGRRVLMMVLAESALVGLVGGVVGMALGWAALALVSRYSTLLGGTTIPIRPYRLVQALVVVLALGLGGGVLPGWRASRLPPVVALRHEGGTSGARVRRLPWGGLVVQGLWQRAARTLLTLGAIALTVGTIAVLEGVVQGAGAALTDIAVGTNAEIMVNQADAPDVSQSALDERVVDGIGLMPEVEHASGMVMTIITVPGAGGPFVLQGYAPGGYAVRRFSPAMGNPLTGNRQVLLGRIAAEAMGRQVGDSVELGGRRFRVVGIFETGVAWEEMGGIISLRDAQSFIGRPGKVTMISVKLHDPALASIVISEVQARFPEAHAALAGQFVEQMPNMQMGNGILGAISGLAVAVGGVGVLNTMLMAVSERTREIGVLRALGWRRRAVLGLIIREALLLGVLAGLVGIGVALGLSLLLQRAPVMGEVLTPRWEWPIFARAIVIAVMLGLLGGLYPAYRATRLQPVEALRYE